MPTDNLSARPPELCFDPKDYTQHGGTEGTEDTEKGERERRVNMLHRGGYAIFPVRGNFMTSNISTLRLLVLFLFSVSSVLSVPLCWV
jgi:hypothetical protein